MDSPPAAPIIQDNTDFNPINQDVRLSEMDVSRASEFLPIEMIEAVIDQASDDSESLRALSLLCKELLTRARFHLFPAIIIRSAEQMDASPEFLDSHPWVLPLVQRVTLSGCTPGSTDETQANIPILGMIRDHLLSQLPNLRTWRMDGGIGPWRWEGAWLTLHQSTLLSYRTYGGHIQELELAGIPFQDVTNFSELVLAFTTLRSLTCSVLHIWTQHGLGLGSWSHNWETIRKLSKPLTIQHLSILMCVDTNLVAYLLRASMATLETLVMTISIGGRYEGDMEICFELIGQLSKLSSLTLVIPATFFSKSWIKDSDGDSPIQRIQWATRILEHIAAGTARPSAVCLQIELQTIAALAGPLSHSVQSLEACTALEKALLGFHGIEVQLEGPGSGMGRAGRAEFWSSIIQAAFPKLIEQQVLTLPHSHPSDPLGHEFAVSCLVASPNSKWIATGSDDGTIIIWDVENPGAIMQQWLAHCGPIIDLNFSPDGQQLISQGGNIGETLVVWGFHNGVSKLAVLESGDFTDSEDSMPAGTCAWSPDGTLIASQGREGPVQVWNARTFQQCDGSSPDNPKPEAPNSYYKPLHWSPDSCYLGWISHNYSQECKEIVLWSPRDKKLKKLPAHTTCTPTCSHFNITALSFDPRNTHIATSQRCTSRHDLVESQTMPEEGTHTLEKSGHAILVHDIASGASLIILERLNPVSDISFSPDGGSLLCVSDDGSIKIWDTSTWQEIAALGPDGGRWWEGSPRACFSPDGKYVANTSTNSETSSYTVRLWRIGETTCTAVFREHETRVSHLTFSPNGQFLASGDDDGLVRIRRLSDFIEY